MQNSAAVESASISAGSLSMAARCIYREGPFPLRRLQHYRPYICPFETLIEHTPPDAEILDVGCGGGLFLCLLASVGRIRRGVGFDLSGPAIELAKAAAASGATGTAELEFQRRDVADGWPAGRFDVVSIIDVLHHVPPDAWADVLNEAVAHLRPGGLLLYKDMCRRPRWRALANRLHDLALARQWINYVPIEQVDAWARRAGLEMIASDRLNRLWYGHELRVFKVPEDAHDPSDFAAPEGAAGHG